MSDAKNSLNSKPLRAMSPKDQTQLIVVKMKNIHKQAVFTVGIQDFKPTLMRANTDSLLSAARSGVEKRRQKSKNFKKTFTLRKFKLLFLLVWVFCWLPNKVSHVSLCVKRIFCVRINMEE